ncbi:MAG: RNA polymerase sigma factor [Flammeovirgaceae bacterium]
MALPNEQELLDRVRTGDKMAYRDLVDHYKSYAYTIAMKVLNQRAEAEEASQDAFIKAYQNIATFKGEAKFSSWLYRIVFNTAISYKRKMKPTFTDIESRTIAHPHEGERTVEFQDRQRYVAKAIDQLNEADKLAVQLFYLQEFSMEEVADIMQQPANTVKVRIHRARQRLANELTTLLKKEALTL